MAYGRAIGEYSVVLRAGDGGILAAVIQQSVGSCRCLASGIDELEDCRVWPIDVELEGFRATVGVGRC